MAARRPAPEAPPPPADRSRGRSPSRAALAGAGLAVALLLTVGLAVTQRAATTTSPASPSPPRRALRPPGEPTAAGPAASVPEPAEPEGRTVLVISSLPADAQVFIAGVERGRTPLVVHDPPAGSTLVRVEKEGFAAAHRLARIGPGRPVGLEVTLQPRQAAPLSLDVLSLPDGATLTVDGAVIGRTNLFRLPLTPGYHVLEFQKEGFAPWAQEVLVGPESDRVIVRLEPSGP